MPEVVFDSESNFDRMARAVRNVERLMSSDPTQLIPPGGPSNRVSVQITGPRQQLTTTTTTGFTTTTTTSGSSSTTTTSGPTAFVYPGEFVYRDTSQYTFEVWNSDPDDNSCWVATFNGEYLNPNYRYEGYVAGILDDGFPLVIVTPSCCTTTTTTITPPTTTTTTTTTQGPCNGECEWGYSYTTMLWSLISSTCQEGCACFAPSYCPPPKMMSLHTHMSWAEPTPRVVLSRHPFMTGTTTTTTGSTGTTTTTTGSTGTTTSSPTTTTTTAAPTTTTTTAAPTTTTTTAAPTTTTTTPYHGPADVCTFTPCGYFGTNQLPPNCTGTTTTSGPECTTTTSSTTTAFNCSLGCDFICLPVYGWQQQTNNCSQSCPCSFPNTYCGTNCDKINMPCVQITTIAPSCNGSCRFVWVTPEGMDPYWLPLSTNICTGGESNCYCDSPSMPGDVCAQETTTPCYVHGTSTGSDGCTDNHTTTTAFYSCDTANCIWATTDGMTWNDVIQSCPFCQCQPPIFNPTNLCQQQLMPCGPTTTTTTTSGPTTTTTSGSTTSTTTTGGSLDISSCCPDHPTSSGGTVVGSGSCGSIWIGGTLSVIGDRFQSPESNGFYDWVMCTAGAWTAGYVTPSGTIPGAFNSVDCNSSGQVVITFTFSFSGVPCSGTETLVFTLD